MARREHDVAVLATPRGAQRFVLAILLAITVAAIVSVALLPAGRLDALMDVISRNGRNIRVSETAAEQPSDRARALPDIRAIVSIPGGAAAGAAGEAKSAEPGSSETSIAIDPLESGESGRAHATTVEQIPEERTSADSNTTVERSTKADGATRRTTMHSARTQPPPNARPPLAATSRNSPAPWHPESCTSGVAALNLC